VFFFFLVLIDAKAMQNLATEFWSLMRADRCEEAIALIKANRHDAEALYLLEHYGYCGMLEDTLSEELMRGQCRAAAALMGHPLAMAEMCFLGYREEYEQRVKQSGDRHALALIAFKQNQGPEIWMPLLEDSLSDTRTPFTLMLLYTLLQTTNSRDDPKHLYVLRQIANAGVPEGIEELAKKLANSNPREAMRLFRRPAMRLHKFAKKAILGIISLHYHAISDPTILDWAQAARLTLQLPTALHQERGRIIQARLQHVAAANQREHRLREICIFGRAFHLRQIQSALHAKVQTRWVFIYQTWIMRVRLAVFASYIIFRIQWYIPRDVVLIICRQLLWNTREADAPLWLADIGVTATTAVPL
jgi:hypothetical protein